jgi:hypothetical protein
MTLDRAGNLIFSDMSKTGAKFPLLLTHKNGVYDNLSKKFFGVR